MGAPFLPGSSEDSWGELFEEEVADPARVGEPPALGLGPEAETVRVLAGDSGPAGFTAAEVDDLGPAVRAARDLQSRVTKFQSDEAHGKGRGVQTTALGSSCVGTFMTSISFSRQ